MSWDIEWCEICDGHHGPGQHPTAAESAIAARNAELHTELARVRAELTEANNRWHSACDVGRRLEVRNAQLLGELTEARARVPLAERCDNYATALDAWNAEITLRRKAEAELETARAALADKAHMLELFAKQRESLQRYKAATKQARALIEEMTNSDAPRSYLGAYEGLRALIGGLP